MTTREPEQGQYDDHQLPGQSGSQAGPTYDNTNEDPDADHGFAADNTDDDDEADEQAPGTNR